LRALFIHFNLVTVFLSSVLPLLKPCQLQNDTDAAGHVDISTDLVPFLSSNLCEVSEPLYAVSGIIAREDASDSWHYLFQAQLLRRTSGGVLLESPVIVR
jgi:hypothetical protein